MGEMFQDGDRSAPRKERRSANGRFSLPCFWGSAVRFCSASGRGGAGRCAPASALLIGAEHMPTLKYRLKFTKECTGGLEIHADTSFGDDINDRKSTSCVCHMLNHSLFDWSCKKQSTVSLSSCEAELNTFNYAIVNIEGLLQLLKDAEIDVPKPVVVYQDNKSIISILKTDSFKQRTKYLQIKLCHAKEYIRNGLLQIQYLAGKDIPADLLSKPISKEQHQKLTKYLQLY